MIRDLTLDQIQSFVTNSALILERTDVERGIRSLPTRPLTKDEIAALTGQGNTAEDWGRIRVTNDFSARSIVGSRFEGEVHLDQFTPDLDLPPDERAGIYHSTVADCVVGAGARIARCERIARCVVAPRAIIDGARRIAATGESTDFGNSLELLHEDLFSRRLRAVAELPFHWAAWVTSPEAADLKSARITRALAEMADAYAETFRSDRAYIGPGAKIRSAAIVENCWISQGVEIDGAGSLRDSTIWSAPGEPTVIRDGAQVFNSLVGPGCMVENGASIERSILFEHVFAGTQAVIKGCGIAANSRLCECEANDSLLGPFTTAIHHGLILGAWWPEGKGNISYGSNVGSNHTGRAPDQEIFPGEGVFYGLGCNIKFPSNFREAPYSIIATGVDTLPQRVAFPFSLIMPPDAARDGLSPAINEIRPGWTILHNAYGLERQERNLFARFKGRRSPVELAIFRPAILEQTAKAADRLRAAASKAIYSDKEIPGLGKNFMIEAARIEAIRAYEFAQRFGAARMLLRELANGTADNGLLRRAGDAFGTHEPRKLIEAALEVEAEWHKLIRASKEKDARRGREILEDYEQRHLSGDDDPLIAAVQRDLDRMRRQIPELLSRLSQPVTP